MATSTPIRGRKGGSSSSRTPTEQPDDLQSVAKAKILVALGEGEFAGQLTAKDIYLDGTPLENADGSQNFGGVAWEFRPGTQAQKYIQGIPGTENEISVGTEVSSSTAWTHTFTNTQLSAVRLRLKWPSLFKQENDGDLVGYSINYAIDLQTDGGTWQTVLNTSVTGKTTSGYERSHRIDLPQAGSTWTVRLRKLTADANSAKIGDTMTLQSYTEVIDAKLRYPNTALLYIEFDSSQFNGSIPQIACEPRGRVIRVPDTYDPETRTYSGTWTGAFKWAWTDNPAWIFYDLVVSDRFGLGHRLTAANIDKWTLYQIAQYCDQMVPDGKGGDGTEPRYTCNVYIQDRNDAYTVLRDFAAIFRGMTYWGGDQIVALADMPRDVDYSYTRANVVGGRFTYSSSTTKTRYTTALVSWSDPGNAYADAMEPVFEQALVARYGFNQLEMTAIGCTRQSEANRKGRWGILTNNKDRVVSFDVGLDGNIPQPGYIIAVADELLSGKVMGGRISAVNGRVIKLDRVADAAAGDRLILNLPSGASQSRTIQAVNGESVTVTTAYSETPQAEAVWVVESDELYAQQYRVVSVSDNDDGTFSITGAWHDPDKYARIDTGAIIDQRPVSVIPPGNQSPPANIVINSFSVVQQNVNVQTMRVSWDQAKNAIAYEAQWRRNDGNWVNVPRSSTTSFDVPGIYAGRYLVRVRAINAAEISSGWGYSEEKTLTGKVGNPPKPVGFIASENVVFGIELNWGFPANTDDTLKTEIQYSLTGTEDDAMLLADVPYPQRKYQQMGLKAGQIFWYRAQLVDRSGNESGHTDWVRGQASIDVSDITDVILEEIKDSEVFKDLIESAVESSEKLAELSDAIRENADGLAAAVGSNKQTAEAIIGNALAIADVVVRQTAQQGANSATFEQLREVIATETEARVTDVTRLEAQTAQNEAGITDVRQALATETEARASAVSQLTAATQAASDKADSAAAVGAQNTASITDLSQVVTDLDSSMASRLEELGAQTDKASGGIQNNAIALITNTLAQVNQRMTQSVQYGDNKASIERVDNVMADASKAVAESLKTLDSSAGGNTANVTDFAKTMADFSQVSATQINSLKVTVNGQSAAIIQNSQVSADINNNLNAMYSIKVAVDSNGNQYAAGMGIGVQNTPSGMQTQVLFLADRFAVMTQAGGAVTLPFVIQNGQAIIRDTVIGDGTIGNA
ncbi:phage tail protein, partial [Enterobacter mori]